MVRPPALPTVPLALLAGLLCLAFGAPTARAQEIPPPGVPLAVAAYAPVPIDFGYVSVRQAPPSVLVSVRNLGGADLEVSEIASSEATYTVEPTSLPPIGPGGSATVRITFTPTAAGTDAASVVFTSNDAFNPVYALPVTAEAVDISIAVNRPHWLLVPSQAVQFSAAVTGSPDPSVTWSVEGDGTISATGRYTAPATSGSAVIRATSVIDPASSGTATVTVLAPEVTEPADAVLGAGRFGTKVVVADLDGDGLLEVISAAPEADVAGGAGTVPAAGAVWIRTFGGEGFTDDPLLLTSPAPVTGGGFGAALQVADLNGDGRPDLAVGEPGGTGAVAGSGAVQVFFGDGAGGFDPPVTAAPPGGAAGDGFGSALMAGYFGGVFVPTLFVGAPGEAVDGQPGAGAAHLLDVSSGTPSFPLVAPLAAPTPQAGAAFGAALSTACLDACTGYGLSSEPLQYNDLVVGAPAAPVTVDGATLAGAGRVFAFTAVDGSTPPAFDPGAEVYSPAPAADAAFGAAVLAGDLTLDVLGEIVVGAPGQVVPVAGSPVNTGMVFVFGTDGVGGYQPLLHLRAPGSEPDARFGETLGLYPVFASNRLDLAVGVPGGAAGGALALYRGTGGGNFSELRLFTAPDPAPGDGFGEGFAWGDLTGDGIPDLVAGVPGAAGAAGADTGSLQIRLNRPVGAITVNPRMHTVARSSTTGRTQQYRGNVPAEEQVWSLLGEGATISSGGLLKGRPVAPDPLSDEVTVLLQDPADDHHWGLARAQLVDRVAVLTNPELLTDSSGNLVLGLPQAGAHFGTVVGLAHLGRALTDPFRLLPSVLGTFPTVSSTLNPRITRFPADDDTQLPFASIQFYFGRPEDVRTNWGSQMVTGDFNGDGNLDLAVGAPLAPSSDGSEVEVGFVDLYLLDAQGALTGSLIRIAPSRSMLGPDGNPLWAEADARSNSRYGYRLLAHDLNGDGIDDLVVGFPHADLYGIRDAGLVEVLYAPPSGNWLQGFLRATLAEPVPRQGAYFGSSLAVSDLAGTGRPELVVGAPGRDPEGLEVLLRREGVVHVFAPLSWNQTSAEGLRIALNQGPHLLIPDPEPAPTGYYSGFGMSLRAFDFGGAATGELAVGSPYRVVVDPLQRDFQGVPRKREVGGVDLFEPAGGLAVRHVAELRPPFLQTGMHFGEQLDSGHLAGASGPNLLAVTSPFYDTAAGANTGGVFLFGPDPDGRPILRTVVTPHDPQQMDQFGQSIAIGDVNGDGRDELVVGAPNATISVITGYLVYPGRFRGTEVVVETREQAGKMYVIFPGLP